MANIIEIVSIAAIAIISIIFAVYITILKKNGWLDGKSDFYRCPNQNCKRIFQKPIKLKDLSEAPPRIYRACPECGENLETFFGSSSEKLPKIREKPLFHEKKPEFRPIEKRAEVRRVETLNQQQSKVSPMKEKVLVGSSSEKLPKIREKPLFHEKKPEFRPIEKRAEVRRVETLNQQQSKVSPMKEKVPIMKRITERKKTNTGNDFGCKYFFGYLASREKQDEIPETCLECPRSLDCMLSRYKSNDSVAEISKWYHVTA